MHRILIIDDAQAIHDDFRKILSPPAAAPVVLTSAKAALFGAPVQAPTARSYDVVFAYQGQEGFEKLNQAVAAGKPFSVAFVDMRMPPGWDGLQTIQRLWEADPELQVVICSAYSDHSWDEITSKLGLTDRLLILKKPFDPVEVTQLATSLSEKWTLKRQAMLKLDELERLVDQRTRDLAHAATHDKLTGLPNRTVLRDRLARVVGPGGAAEPFALFFLDFDRFKVVNDSLGHDAGDQLLIEIARRLTAALESEECASRCRQAVAARMGGDEFVVFMEGTPDAEQAEVVAEFLLRTLSAPHRIKGYNLSSTASIGITTSELGYTNPADVLRDADNAMYHAKALGKARHVLFDRKMHQAAKDRLVLENELRGAVARNEMVLHYQPLVNTEDGTLRGFEALVRWNHPTRGLVMPEEFISCAEETGVIDELGTWALREACLQLERWRVKFPSASDLIMSVNVSPRQLVSRQIFDQVRTVLTQTNADPARLALEITESAVIADPNYTIDLLKQLKLLGVRVYLDDFGTGYTSLSYLHRLPVDGLKMDRSFMRSVGERRDYAAIVHAIISLAQNLGIHVIAEGIETEPQLVMLQTMGCSCGQGFYFGRSEDAKGVEKYLTHTWGGNWAQAA